MRRMLAGAALLSALADAMLAARMLRTSSIEFVFLAWNLALAWAPVALAGLAVVLARRGSRVLAACVGLGWWLFFPNSIYLVTDLAYAGHSRGAILWFDTAMLAVFAFAGSLLAIASLETMRALVAAHARSHASWAFAAFVCLTAGVGVWLGRVRRWNSWDALIAPHRIAEDALALVLSPRAHAAAWAIALVFAGLLATLHLAMRPRSAPAP
jgi:uncharacterized membrane protein